MSRSTKFQKKIATPPKPVPKRILYFSPKNKAGEINYSKELLLILQQVPQLAKTISCVNVLEFDVQGISKIPAIDDGIASKPFESTKAFHWVLKEVKRMCDLGQIEESASIKVEGSINRLIRASPPKPSNRGYLYIPKNRSENTWDKYKPSTKVENLREADYKGRNMFDIVGDIEKRRNELQAGGHWKNEHYRNSEEYRAVVLDEARKELERKGLVDPKTGAPIQRPVIRRDNLKKIKSLTIGEGDLQRFERERERMLDDLRRNVNPMQRDSIRRESIRTVRTVNDRDIQDYNQQRMSMAQSIQRLPATAMRTPLQRTRMSYY